MSQQQKQWEDEVFESMKGSQPALPDPALFDRIKSQISHDRKNSVELHQLKFAIAAAILLLLVNSTSLYYLKNQESKSKNEQIANSYKKLLLDSYIIY